MKFKVLKPVLLKKAITAVGKVLDLDPEHPDTKKLVATGHIADPKAKSEKADDQEPAK